MQSWGLGFLADKKIEILKELEIKKKNEPNFRIIDIGGAKEKHYLDKFKFIDYVVDINKANTIEKNIVNIIGNINEESTFSLIEKNVKKYGKFDYCICTHTLEDIRNPQLVLKNLSNISKSGLISFPSKYLELSRFEKPFLFRGFHHHRWIFTIKNNKVVAIPKTNMIEHKIFNKIENKYHDSIGELFIEWEQEIDFETLNNDYLGPTHLEIFKLIKDTLLNSDEDRLINKPPFLYKSKYFKQYK